MGWGQDGYLQHLDDRLPDEHLGRAQALRGARRSRASARPRRPARPIWSSCTPAWSASTPRTRSAASSVSSPAQDASEAVHADRRRRLRRRRRWLAEEVPVRGLLPRARPGYVAPRQAGRSGGDRPVLPHRAAGRRPHPAHLRGHHDAPGMQSQLHLLHRAVDTRPRALAHARRHPVRRCSVWSSAAPARWCCSARSPSATAAI